MAAGISLSGMENVHFTHAGSDASPATERTEAICVSQAGTLEEASVLPATVKGVCRMRPFVCDGSEAAPASQPPTAAAAAMPACSQRGFLMAKQE
jgi:hypothetical protein